MKASRFAAAFASSFAPNRFQSPFISGTPPTQSLQTRHALRKTVTPALAPSRRSAVLVMTETDASGDKLQYADTVPLEARKSDFTSDDAAAFAQALLDDVADRPEYYLNVTGVLLGAVLSAVVLSATLHAIASVPILPDALRMIGLLYLFWFLNNYLFSAQKRQVLGDEISEFVAGVRDGTTKKLNEFEDA